MSTRLKDVPETLLIPLWARAAESVHPDPIIRDDKAVDMIKKIDYDFSKFEHSWMSQVGVAIRTELLDKSTQDFIVRHPKAVIINIGAGLDTRFSRIDNGSIRWYDLDLPEVIALKKQFFEENDRYRMIAKSVFDTSWYNEIERAGAAVLILAEGILMYFDEEQVKSLFHHLITHFPGAMMLFEMLAPFMVGKSKHHEAVKKIGGAEFKWGISNSRVMESWNPHIRIVNEANYFDYHKKRWRGMRFLAAISILKHRMNNRIVQVQFQ
ncbi:methyltransferase [candidate division KSB3 bacterium]|uniref:Methyltransferase n=1 Tax=candidate division KSB3 bacterium TaxID=2044937 RepID=A0A2G6E762_9BACT|nr:MAG: methyltransferase [candidate division KSB3 bacterium]PIE29977.1 MAG: methyltransferase [candidate division KSB3 bacterium]